MTEENVAELKRASEDFNIEIAAISAVLRANGGAPGETETDFDKIVSDCKMLNCNYIRIGMFPTFSWVIKIKSWSSFGRSEKMAENLGEQGIELYYHTHHIEFQKYDGEIFARYDERKYI